MRAVRYGDLGPDDQVEALRPAALAAAERFGLEVDRMEVAAHAFNTTFSVWTCGGDRVALRVHTNSMSTLDDVRAQLAWQHALADETDVRVPRPLAAGDGDRLARVHSDGYGAPVVVTAASWLEGPDVGDPGLEVARALGRTMALLHAHARRWRPPAGSRLARFDTPLLGRPDRVRAAPGLDRRARDVLARAFEECGRAYDRVLADEAPRALHADLHGGNLKWHDGRLAVFDFDDCRLGVPVLDLAITTFYLRDDEGAVEEAVRGGYREVAPLPRIEAADFEALVAARQLLLANTLLASSTASLRARSASYLETTVDRLAQWQHSGRFRGTRPRHEPG